MKCPKCGSENVNVQVVTESQINTKHHGIFWWIFVGWYWVPIKWMCFFWLALLVKIFAPKRQKLNQKHVSKCVCQNCGHMWNA